MTEETKDQYLKALDERESFYKTQLTQYSENLKRLNEAVSILNGGIQGIQESKALYLKNQSPVIEEPGLPVTDEAK